jgi:hypothetical protein
MHSYTRMFTACLLALLLAFSYPHALAEKLISLTRAEAGESYAEYPLLSGYDNAFAQESVNVQIQKEVQPHLNTLQILSAGGSGILQLDSEYMIFPSSDGHDVLSLLLTAEGRMPPGRTGHQYIPLLFDLANGQPVYTAVLWLDPAAAQAGLEEMTRNEFEDILSNYLNIEDLFPLPMDNALITTTGIGFYYPENSLTWLSGRSASIHYLYHELEGFLALGEGSLLGGLGIQARLSTQADSAEKIGQVALQGSLPGIDVKLGDSIENVVGAFKLLYDPEGFPGGESYQLEDDRFRGTILISTGNGSVTGILSKRMNLFGLITGRSKREEALSLLGEPPISMPLDTAAAGLYGLEPGSMDSYPYGEMELRLMYDMGDILRAIWLIMPE